MVRTLSQFLFPLFLLLLALPAELFALSESDFHLVASKYDVPVNLLKAIGFVETQGGKIIGTHQVQTVVNSTQLKYLKKIARHTGRPLADFNGSYAGAMGYMQFIPSTFYIYAQDGDGNGIKDPLNHHDSLATAAYFLAYQFAKHKDFNLVLKRYNNSAVYCQKVIRVYRKLEGTRIVLRH